MPGMASRFSTTVPPWSRTRCSIRSTRAAESGFPSTAAIAATIPQVRQLHARFAGATVFGVMIWMLYVRFIVPGLVMLSLIQNAFLNSASSLFVAKIQGTIVDLLVEQNHHHLAKIAKDIAAAGVVLSAVAGSDRG